MGNDSSLPSSNGDFPFDSSPFNFFDLPALVQWKILRQYIRFSEKVTVLGNMPEFSECLMDNQSPCWLIGSKSLYQLLPILCALSPGFYIRADDPLPHHGYYVEFDRENYISFICCAIIIPKTNGYEKYSISIIGRKPTISVKHFLHHFLSQYVLEECHVVESYSDRNYKFLMNQSHKSILWENLSIYDIKDERCSIKRDKKRTINLSIYPDFNIVRVNNGYWIADVPRDKSLYSSKSIFKPSFKVSKYCFDMTGKHTVNISVEIINHNIYQFYKEESYCPFSWFDDEIKNLANM